MCVHFKLRDETLDASNCPASNTDYILFHVEKYLMFKKDFNNLNNFFITEKLIVYNYDD